ncbi:2-phosphoglycerate kinase [Methanococcus voltae]|uniref:2-phosphoglycerate kinase n=1 Tax=Methanococcus voltae (strain ATCC BAA-1334 / A3) TaxID=456320 RepID=D7DQL8_METV3|nr:2-phosphoglycerate kinase [Methanococcus voltae]MCS3901619.1 2-phosphoglycerate kinase [Methanococcus voltae]
MIFDTITDKIIVTAKDYEMPFSKGLLARSLTTAGMKPSEAYIFARGIEADLNTDSLKRISKYELRQRVYYSLISDDYEDIADKYLIWRRILKKHSVIILVGGSSGVGTSTIAFELASRLGISSVIGTDSIREVMRRSISKDVVPMLYESSYTAWRALRNYDEEDDELYIQGFLRHVEPVLLGIEGIIDRCLTEGTSVIIEGTHILPGMISDKYHNIPNVIFLTLTLSSENVHKKRFIARAKVSDRPLERYLENFEIIKDINKYIVKDSNSHLVPVIENVSISDTVQECLEIVTNKFNTLDKEEGGEMEEII